MILDVKIPLQQALAITAKDKTVGDLLHKQAIQELSERDCDMSEYDLDRPHFIARDACIVVQFFEKRKDITER